MLAAVSGGADSVCLLELLLATQRHLGIEVMAFHLNHRLRQNSDRDQQFVRTLCARHRVELVVVTADVAGFARRHRLGIEEAGRALRYRHLASAAQRSRCNKVALGHTADDNLETILLNLVRGAGPEGLAGIPVRRDIYIRPLIDAERAEIERHLAAHGIEWAEDETNLDPGFRRNRLRLDVLPVLRQLNPEAAANARRAARLLADENAFLERLSAGVIADCIKKQGRLTLIDTRSLRNYTLALIRRAVKQLFPELDSGSVSRIIQLASRTTGAKVSLSQGVTARLCRGTIEISRPGRSRTDA